MPNKYLDSEGLAEYTTIVKAALDTKAPLVSPALTGTPTAPTPTPGDSSIKVATTAYVQAELEDYVTLTELQTNYLPLSGGTVTGNLSVTGVVSANAINTLQRNTTYAVGDIAYSANLGSKYYLECTTAGTTGATEPDFSNVSTTGVIVDGTCTFTVRAVANTDEFLPLVGGTMTGTIIAGFPAMLAPTNAGTVTIAGGAGTGAADGAKLILNGAEREAGPGEFTVQAGKSGGYKQFVGKPDGTLTWGGSNVAVTGTLQNGHGILTGHKDNISVSANSYAQGTISFGQTFSSVPMVVVCGGVGHAHINASCTNITATGFGYVVSSEGPAFTNERVNWIAIG